MKPRIGFIGLGMMGHGMARNIIDKGFPLGVVGHRSRQPVEDLKARGAQEHATPAALAAACDIVLICVGGSPAVEALTLGEDGIIHATRPGLTVVDSTTSNPVSTRAIATRLAERGTDFADAPVTRAPKDAEAGRLNSLVGASEAVFARILPVLQAYSETVTRFGEVGAGHTAKLVNNFITMGYCALIAEGMAVCAAAGVDMRKLYDVMAGGGANSGVLRKMIPPFLEGDLTGHAFAIANGRKDVSYFREMAKGLGVDSILVEPLLATYDEALRLGLGERLMASLMELHEMRNGLRIVPRDR